MCVINNFIFLYSLDVSVENYALPSSFTIEAVILNWLLSTQICWLLSIYKCKTLYWLFVPANTADWAFTSPRGIQFIFFH